MVGKQKVCFAAVCGVALCVAAAGRFQEVHAEEGEAKPAQPRKADPARWIVVERDQGWRLVDVPSESKVRMSAHPRGGFTFITGNGNAVAISGRGTAIAIGGSGGSNVVVSKGKIRVSAADQLDIPPTFRFENGNSFPWYHPSVSFPLRANPGLRLETQPWTEGWPWPAQ